MTLAGFAAVFLLGRAGEPVRPLLLSRKERLPIADLFGIYALERLFDLASAAVIAASGLLLFQSHGHVGDTAGKLETAARTTGSLLFAGVAAAIVFLLYLRLHGSALLERRLHGWVIAHGWRARIAGIFLGFARGVPAIGAGRRLAGGLLPCLYGGLWSRKRGRSRCVDCHVADYVCGVQPCGCAAADS